MNLICEKKKYRKHEPETRDWLHIGGECREGGLGWNGWDDEGEILP